MKASGGLWQSIDTSEWRGQRKGRKERRKGSTTSNWGGETQEGNCAEKQGKELQRRGGVEGRGKGIGVYLV